MVEGVNVSKLCHLLIQADVASKDEFGMKWKGEEAWIRGGVKVSKSVWHESERERKNGVIDRYFFGTNNKRNVLSFPLSFFSFLFLSFPPVEICQCTPFDR